MPRKGPVWYSTDESRDLSLSPRILLSTLRRLAKRARNLLCSSPTPQPVTGHQPEGHISGHTDLAFEDGLSSSFYCPLLDFKLTLSQFHKTCNLFEPSYATAATHAPPRRSMLYLSDQRRNYRSAQVCFLPSEIKSIGKWIKSERNGAETASSHARLSRSLRRLSLSRSLAEVQDFCRRRRRPRGQPRCKNTLAPRRSEASVGRLESEN